MKFKVYLLVMMIFVLNILVNFSWATDYKLNSCDLYTGYNENILLECSIVNDDDKLYFNKPSNEKYSLVYFTNEFSNNLNRINLKYKDESKWYFNDYSEEDDDNKCRVELKDNNRKLNLDSNLNDLFEFDKDVDLKYNLEDLENLENILKKYYYMRTEVKAELYKEGKENNLKKTIYFKEDGNNYVLAEPNSVKLNLNELKGVNILNEFGSGKYYWKITATPIDGKCDFNRDGELDENEFEISVIYYNYSEFSNELDGISPFEVFEDGDGDGWADDDSGLGKGNDLCPDENGKDNFQGCDEEYTNLGCYGKMEFGDSELVCDSDMFKFDSNKNCNIGSESNCGWKDIRDVKNSFSSLLTDSNSDRYSPNLGSGRYLCVKDNYWSFTFSIPPLKYEPEKVEGYCDLRFNGRSYCNIGDYKVMNGNSIKLYKYNYILGSNEDFKEFICSNDENLNLKKISTDDYSYQFPIVLDNTFSDFERDENGMIYDPTLSNPIKCDLDTNICEFDGTNIDFNNIVNLTKSIKKYKNGVLVEETEINPSIITLQASKIRKFSDSDKLKNFVDKSVSIMENYNIVQNITYDSSTDTSNIKISLRDSNVSIQNLTIYQIISKDDVENFDDIKFIDNGGGELIVIDKDPVISWYFNESTEDSTVEYEIEGDTDGGTIIVTQEPILFNEGELIINYREGQDGCADGEIHLFDIDTLEDSKILDKNTGTYQICVGHLNSSINLFADNDHIRYINISSYLMDDVMNLNFSKYNNKVEMSTDNSDIYWDMRIQKDNPNGNFSCLGSLEKLDGDSLFGDCGYVENNRIWLHLGADYLAPETRITIPYVSHNQKVYLDSEDNIGGSGFKNLTYRIVDETSWTTTINSHVELDLSCETDWGCKKVIEAYSYDNAGNKEENKLFTVNIVDKGSACQSDCMSKPSPNRFMKECNNINGCDYYNYNADGIYDNGDYVAGICNFLTKDSWVKYNSTHDIKCPSGPFSPSRFTNENLDILNSACENIIKTPYPIIINGEQLIMDIITCNNPYNKNK